MSHVSRVCLRLSKNCCVPKPANRPLLHVLKYQSRSQSTHTDTTALTHTKSQVDALSSKPSTPICKITEVPPRPKRLVIGITGATGTVFAIRLLEILRELKVETHLVISKWALATLKYETSLSETHIRGLATHTYTAKDMSAPIASGSFQHDGMLIVPCSMKTLAAVRSGFCDDLISRAADVTMKENRRLMMVVRETPLSDVHLDNMLFLRRAGAIMFPPVPAFYTRPATLDDIINQSVGRMLDSFGIRIDGFERWDGFKRD